MPNTKSAKKRLRQNEERRDRNRAGRTQVRSIVKRVRKAVEEGNVPAAEELFRTAARKLDQAGAARLIHKNAASRTKSRLQHLIKKAKNPAAAAAKGT